MFRSSAIVINGKLDLGHYSRTQLDSLDCVVVKRNMMGELDEEQKCTLVLFLSSEPLVPN